MKHDGFERNNDKHRYVHTFAQNAGEVVTVLTEWDERGWELISLHKTDLGYDIFLKKPIITHTIQMMV